MSHGLYGTKASYLLPCVDICRQQMWKVVYYKGQNRLRNWPSLWTWFLYLPLSSILSVFALDERKKNREKLSRRYISMQSRQLNFFFFQWTLFCWFFPQSTSVLAEVSVWHVSLPWNILAWSLDISGLKLDRNFLLV